MLSGVWIAVSLLLLYLGADKPTLYRLGVAYDAPKCSDNTRATLDDDDR